MLVGCDFLSTLDSDILSSLTTSETSSETDTTISETDTTLSETETTLSTIPTTQTTTQPTTGTTTEDSTTTSTATTTLLYEVVFYNADGSLLDSQLIAVGAAALPPEDPTLQSTAQFDYTFAGWDKSFDEITGPLEVYATYIETLRQYTVTFYDADQLTVLFSVEVDYGAAATAPEAPVLTGFDFSGWDKPYDFINRDLSVYPTFTTAFDHMLLVEFMVNRFEMNPENPTEIEAAIDMMLLMTDIPTESELYQLLLNGEILIGQVQDITSLPELQTWFASLSAAGFDEQQIVDFLINLLVFQVDQGVASFDLQYYLDEIAFFEAKIIENVTLMNDIDDAVALYCETVPVYNAACLDYYEANLLSLNWEDSYYALMAQAREFDWYDWNFMYTLEYRLWDYIWNENELAYDDYLVMLSTLEEPAKSIYTDLGSIYLAW